MTMILPKNFYPNSWYVASETDKGLMPILGSVGNKSYAKGFLAALEGFLPHPTYALVNNKGEIAEKVCARTGPRINCGSFARSG